MTHTLNKLVICFANAEKTDVKAVMFSFDEIDIDISEEDKSVFITINPKDYYESLPF